jgi:putative ABC transport system permease protein
MSYLVEQRTHEIGIRLSVGATRADIVRMILGNGVRLAAWSIVIGLPAAFGGAWLIRHLLFGVRPFDPPTFGTTALLVLAAILAACWIPARRAAKVDPMVALRYE